MCRRWLNRPFGVSKHEWAYKDIPRRIVIEKLLVEDGEGKLPRDYKFYTIHGRCHIIQLDMDRFIGRKKNVYDRDWNPLDLIIGYPNGDPAPKPPNFEKMLQLAEELAQDFDQVRVDLYNLDGKIYFGELTHYPGAGFLPWYPTTYAFEIGARWTLKERYWEGNLRAENASVYF